MTRLLLGPRTRVQLFTRKGLCAIFVNGETETSFTGSTWEEALWKVRARAFNLCAAGTIAFTLSMEGEKSDSLKSPAKGTVSPQQTVM